MIILSVVILPLQDMQLRANIALRVSTMSINSNSSRVQAIESMNDKNDSSIGLL
jgi:hypothetical protein